MTARGRASLSPRGTGDAGVPRPAFLKNSRLKGLRAFGFGVLEPRGIRRTFEAPEEALSRRLSPDQRRQLVAEIDAPVNAGGAPMTLSGRRQTVHRHGRGRR